MNSRDVSVIICTRNAEDDIHRCIASVQKNNPKEILVVDGKSTDRTLEKVKKMQVRCISDQGKGLAYARRMGVEHTSGELVMFVGPDNILSEHFIDELIFLKNEWKFDVASVSTRTKEPTNYWDKGMDFRWVCNMGTPGETDVPGRQTYTVEICLIQRHFQIRI